MKMNNKTLSILVVLVAAVSIVCFIWLTKDTNSYITVTEDRANTCTYNKDGQRISTMVAPREVKVKMPKADYDQYKKDAIAANKCFSVVDSGN
jgi:hypothetical protein